MSHLESGSVVWVRLGQTWWPGTITTVAKCPPEFVEAIRKTPIAIVKFFHENEYQDVHKPEHICPYNCDRKEEFIRKGQTINKNQSHGDVDLLAKFEADVVTAEKLTGGDMDILRSLVEGADTYKAFHHTHCPPTSPGLDSNNTVISGQPSQPLPAFPCPAGVEFEPRPQENLWPERVEAHTRLDCNTSKVRNPQTCQASSSDHQIAPLSSDQPSPMGAIVGGSSDQARPLLGGVPSLVANNCSSDDDDDDDEKEEEEEEEAAAAAAAAATATASSSHHDEANSSHNVIKSGEQSTENDDTTPGRLTLNLRTMNGSCFDHHSEVKGEKVSLIEEEIEDEEESINHVLDSESERFGESMEEDEDEDSLNLEQETDEYEEEDQDISQVDNDGEALETESDVDDPLPEEEDEEDGTLTPLGPEQERLVGIADEDDDSLIPDFETESDEDDPELSVKDDSSCLPHLWETDDDSEEELYRNLPSASATDDDDGEQMLAGVTRHSCSTRMTFKDTQNQTQIFPSPTQPEGVRKNTSTKKRESVPGCVEGKKIPHIAGRKEDSCFEGETKDLIMSDSLREVSKVTLTGPVIQQTTLKHHRDHLEEREQMEEMEKRRQEEEEEKEENTEVANENFLTSQLRLSEPPLTHSRRIDHSKDWEPAHHSSTSDQESSAPVSLTFQEALSALDFPSTSKSPDHSLTFEGFDGEKTRLSSARLLMLLNVKHHPFAHRGQRWNTKAVVRSKGRPPLRAHVKKLQGKKRTVGTPLKKKRNKRAASNATTSSSTSDTDRGTGDEPERGKQRIVRSRGGQSSTRWVKHKSARGRPGTRKSRSSTQGKKILCNQHTETEEATDKRRTRSNNKEREEEEARKARESLDRFSYSPDITVYSEAPPRQLRAGGGEARKQADEERHHTSKDPPTKRPRKRKQSEVDNLLKWAVVSGHTGSRSRGSRDRHYFPSTPNITTAYTTTSKNNNNNNNNSNINNNINNTNTSSSSNNNNNNVNPATRRSRLEAKTKKKEQRRGRRKKLRMDSEEEREEEEDEMHKEELQRRIHPHSSSDDPLANSEEEIRNPSKAALNKGPGRLGIPYKCGDLVWSQVEGRWWPSYIDQVYPQTRRVSVYRVGLKQETSIKVDLAKIKTFKYGDVPAYVDRSESGFTEAQQVTESFCLLKNHCNKISAHKFFTMPPEEQDALIIVTFTPKDDPVLTTPRGKRTRGQTKEKHPIKAHKGWFYEPVNSSSEDGTDKFEMSAMDCRRMQKSLRSRRRENEKLMKFMNSAACMEHLWQIFSGQKQCERHKLYQSEITRRSLLWTGIGPFQLDQDDDQILSVVDFLHTEMNRKQPDFNLAQDYVFKVWMPEAIKEALRVVLKVPEDMLELALDDGYRENLYERNTRRLDFV